MEQITKEQALEIIAQAINKATGVFNPMELFAIQQAFLTLQTDEHTRKNKNRPTEPNEGDNVEMAG